MNLEKIELKKHLGISRIIQEDLKLIGNPRKIAKKYSNLKTERTKTLLKFYETFLKKIYSRLTMISALY